MQTHIEMRGSSSVGKLNSFLGQKPQDHFDVSCFEGRPQNRVRVGFNKPRVALGEEEFSHGNPQTKITFLKGRWHVNISEIIWYIYMNLCDIINMNK